MSSLKSILLASSIGLAALFAPAAAQDGEVTLFTFETLANDPLLTEYVAKYGAKPNTAVFADEDEAFAKMRAGYAPDVMGPCSYEFGRWQEAGLLQPIDVTKLKYWPVIAQTLKTIPGAMADETHAWFVPQYWAQTSVTYRKDLAPEYAANESWKILFDPKYQGKVAALEGVDDTVTLVAKSMGIDPYKMSDEQWTEVQGKLRELVANAGVTKDTLILRMSEEDWAGVLDVNLTGSFRVAKRAARSMIRGRWGRIVFTGSVVGLYGSPGQVNYSSSKAALVGLARSLTREIGGRGVTANVVAPGFIETDMTAVLSEELVAKYKATTPAGRLGQPEEVAAAIAFLASEQAGFISGAVIPVDGGLGMGH